MLKKLVSKMLVVLIVVLATTQVFIFADTEGMTDGKMIAHYTFDGDLKDSSGNGLDGNAVGDISYTGGVSGKAAKFDGGYVEVAHNDLLNLPKGYTISAWIYPEDVRPNRVLPIVSKLGCSVWDEQPAYTFCVFDRNLQFGGWLVNTADVTWNESSKFVDMKRWTMVTVTSDGDFLKYYVDGVLVDNTPYKAVFPDSSGNLNIGFGNIMGESAFFKGIMDDLQIYNYAKSPQSIKGDYEKASKNSTLVKRPNQLVAYYRFEADLKDYSGNGNDATAISTGEGMAYVTGVIGKGVKFKGNSYLEVKDSDSFSFENRFSFSSWIYDSAPSSKDNQPIIEKLGPSMVSVEEYPAFLINEYRKSPVLTAYQSYTAYSHDFSSESTYPQGSWHMLTVTSNGKTVKFYVDNALKAVKNEKAVIPNSSGKLLIGYNCFGYDETSKYFEGIMDEVKLYNYELQQNDVKTLFELKDGIIIKPADTRLNLTSLKLGQQVKKNQAVKLNITLQNMKYSAANMTGSSGKSNTANNLLPLSSASQNITTKAALKSSNPNVAKVSANGLITIIGKGQADITATYGNYKATQKIVVN
jgi:Bacterial Ig-like domain (group 2).